MAAVRGKAFGFIDAAVMVGQLPPAGRVSEVPACPDRQGDWGAAVEAVLSRLSASEHRVIVTAELDDVCEGHRHADRTVENTVVQVGDLQLSRENPGTSWQSQSRAR